MSEQPTPPIEDLNISNPVSTETPPNHIPTVEPASDQIPTSEESNPNKPTTTETIPGKPPEISVNMVFPDEPPVDDEDSEEIPFTDENPNSEEVSFTDENPGSEETPTDENPLPNEPSKNKKPRNYEEINKRGIEGWLDEFRKAGILNKHGAKRSYTEASGIDGTLVRAFYNKFLKNFSGEEKTEYKKIIFATKPEEKSTKTKATESTEVIEPTESVATLEAKKNIFKGSAEAAMEKGSVRREAIGKKINEVFRFARNTVDSVLGLPEGVAHFVKEANESRIKFQNRVTESGQRFKNRCLETEKKAKDKIVETSKRAAALGLKVTAKPIEQAIEAFSKLPALPLQRKMDKLHPEHFDDQIASVKEQTKAEIQGYRDQIRELQEFIKESKNENKEAVNSLKEQKTQVQDTKKELQSNIDKVKEKAASKRRIRDMIASLETKKSS